VGVGVPQPEQQRMVMHRPAEVDTL
jgi:hypothetical protein